MAESRFQIGDVVVVIPLYTAAALPAHAALGYPPAFAVTQVIPGYVGWHRYRLRSEEDGQEMVAYEAELRLATSDGERSGHSVEPIEPAGC